MPQTAARSRTLALKIFGESMEPDYQNGDIIYVDTGMDSPASTEVTGPRRAVKTSLRPMQGYAHN